MVKVNNLGPIAFRKYIVDKKVIVFGAGRALESCLNLYFENKDIQMIIDNKPDLWGKTINHRGMDVEIAGVSKMIDVFQYENKEDYVLMITSPFYAAEIIEDLDQYVEFEGLECFLQVVVRNTKEPYPDFEFAKGIAKIPKKIHYFWIGGKSLPEAYKKNIETWKQYNPDFEIIQWDESNYDFTKCAYVKEAYETRSWGFVPNYARLDVIYQEGGIYLDTDVEVKRSLDCLLNDEAFFNMGCADRINMGCGFGACQGSKIVYEIKNRFETEHFLKDDGKPGRKPCHTFVHPVFKYYGFALENCYQKKEEFVIYPSEVMSPLTIKGMEDNFTSKTISIHQESGTWKTGKEREGAEKLNKLIMERIKECD